MQVNIISTSDVYEFVHPLHRINKENTTHGIAMSVFHIIKTDIIISIFTDHCHEFQRFGKSTVKKHDRFFTVETDGLYSSSVSTADITVTGSFRRSYKHSGL